MSARWRDKKGEPGFVFHAWMGTVDELEDQIADLVAVLQETRAFFVEWLAPPLGSGIIARIDAAIINAERARLGFAPLNDEPQS